jgi:hypothetical protein
MADDPLTLTAPLELVGQWYTPENEEQPASGRLLFDPVDGLTLETVSDVPLFLWGPDEQPILLGITVDGRLVTLRGVHKTNENYNSRGGVLTRATVRTAFVGMHAATENDLKFHRVEARLSHLNEWCYMSGVDLSKAVFPKGGTIAFRPPTQLVLARTRGALVGVTFDFDGRRDPERTDRPFEITLEQRAWLMIRPTRRWNFDDFGELLTRIRWFFGFAAGAQDQLLELRGEATVVMRGGADGRSYRHREPVWILFTPPSLFAPEHRRASEMLFCRADLRPGELQRPLTRWLFLCRRLSMDPVFGPYFAALATGKMYSDLRFLVFAQAAEAYHARRNPSTKNHRVHYQTRIRLLLEGMPRALRRGIPDSFPKEVTDTRNFGTHRDEKTRARAATGARLYALAELVKLTFDAAILRELGFSQTKIAELVDRNRRVDEMRRRMLEILAETTPGR